MADYHKNRTTADGLQSYCRPCCSDRHWARSLRVKYDLTVEQYDEMLARQQGRCAICERPATADRRLAVDHHHGSQRVRGLLCNICNLGLGQFQDDSTLLVRAAAYLNAS